MKHWWFWLLVTMFFVTLVWGNQMFFNQKKEAHVVPKGGMGEILLAPPPFAVVPVEKSRDYVDLVLKGFGILSGLKTGWELADRIRRKK